MKSWEYLFLHRSKKTDVLLNFFADQRQRVEYWKMSHLIIELIKYSGEKLEFLPESVLFQVDCKEHKLIDISISALLI